MPLKDKTVLITGASSGIGREIAIQLSQHVGHILLSGRNQDALLAVQKSILDAGGSAEVLVADLLKAEDRKILCEKCATLPNGLYGLINNAGSNHFAWLQDQPDALLEQQIQLNLLTPILLTRALLPALHKAGDARILNIGSSFGSIGYPGYTAYCASKFGVRGFTEALRRELADTKLRVLYLAPRATATSLNTDTVEEMNKALGNGMDSADFVATKAVGIFLSGKPNTAFIGSPEKLFAHINQILPALVDNAIRKQLAVIKKFART